MGTPRISYIPLEKMDAAMREEMERCAREGTPRPESSAVRAHSAGAVCSQAWSLNRARARMPLGREGGRRGACLYRR